MPSIVCEYIISSTADEAGRLAHFGRWPNSLETMRQQSAFDRVNKLDSRRLHEVLDLDSLEHLFMIAFEQHSNIICPARWHGHERVGR